MVQEKPDQARGKKPEPGGGGIGEDLSGLSGARPGKPVEPPETGETEIRPPGGLRRRRDHGIDWFTSCFRAQESDSPVDRSNTYRVFRGNRSRNPGPPETV